MEINNHVLLIEDNKEIFKLVEIGLGGIVKLDWVESLDQARKFLNSNKPGLILLDIGLPDGSGVEYCQELQGNNETANIPVFFLTAKNELSEKVMGFAVGADDYIVKPFVPIELKARVEAKLKKQSLLQGKTGVFEWSNIKIDTGAQKVQILKNNGESEIIELTALEFKILAYMAKRPNVVINRDDILNEIWGKNIHVYPRSVDTHVSKLRRKLGKDPDFIESVHGVGYKFNPMIGSQE